MGHDFAFIVDSQATWSTAWTQDSSRAAGLEGAPPVLYRPLGVLLLAGLERWLESATPTPYRVLATLLHSLNAVLLALWLLGLGLTTRRASIAAALWGVMPIHAETMYWASASLDVMASTALLIALLLTTRPTLAWRLGAVGIWIVAFCLQESAIFGSIALLFTMALCPLSFRDVAEAEPRPALGKPAVVGGIAIAAWWTARSLAGVQPPESVPLDWSALGASFGEAVVRSIGLGEPLRAGGPPLHGISFLSGIALLATAWYAWLALRKEPRATAAVLSLSVIGVAQVLFGQSEVGVLVDSDRYFYLTSAFIPVCAVGSWNPPGQPTRRVAAIAAVSIVALIAVWSWSAIATRQSYDNFEALLTREIRVGRASGHIYMLRGIERMKRGDPCAAEMDFRSSYALETNETKRVKARELGLRALEICTALSADAVRSKHANP
jgi:hypothetical protein